MFNCFINDFFFFIKYASAHNFADDNTLTTFAKTIERLFEILISESKAAVEWFHANKMMVNPDKFKSIVISKNSRETIPKEFKIGNDNVQVLSSVKLLGIVLDNKLNFNLHIENICKSASNQLNALVRLKRYLGFAERKVLVNSYILSNFNYCPLVWFVSSKKSMAKIENLQKRALRFLHNDISSSYDELLDKSGKTSINVRIHRILCTEIFKTLKSLNPTFMNEVFELRETERPVRSKYKLNLNAPIVNKVRFGTKSIRSLGPKIWNSLPYEIKSSETLTIFKNLIKDWNANLCTCKICERISGHK